MDRFINILKNKKLFQEFRQSVHGKSSFNELKGAFGHSIELNTKSTDKAAVLFSGGVDSALIAKAVSQKVEKSVLYSVGLEEAKDIKAATEVAKQLNSPLVKRIVEKGEIEKYIEETKEVIKNNDCFQLQIAVPEFIVAEKIKADGLRTVFSGQGSDELFCGYNFFKAVLRKGGYKGVQEKIWQKLENLWEHDLYREQAIAKHFGLEFKTPFLDELFVRKAVSYPAEEKILSPEDDLRKHPIRKLAKELWLPEKVCLRPKKALQYGSGLGKEISRLVTY